MNRAMFVPKCPKFVRALVDKGVKLMAASPVELVARYDRLFPDEFNEGNRSLLQCHDGSSSSGDGDGNGGSVFKVLFTKSRASSQSMSSWTILVSFCTILMAVWSVT